MSVECQVAPGVTLVRCQDGAGWGVPNRGARGPLCTKMARGWESPTERAGVRWASEVGSPWLRLGFASPPFSFRPKAGSGSSGARCGWTNVVVRQMAQWPVVSAERPRPSRLRGERVSWGEWWESPPPFLRADSHSGLKPRGMRAVSVEEK